jgi:dihydroxy-acid dehydratase
VNIPAIFVSGGAMAAGRTPDGEAIDLISVFEGVGAYKTGAINAERLKILETFACPSCGSCSGMFTANSMNCLLEAIGLALPYNGSALAMTGQREDLAREAGKRIMHLVEKQITPRQIVTIEAMDDAFALDMAMGGSTNTVLHGLALAREAELEYSLERISSISERIPYLCKVSPSGKYHMEDVHRAGGVPAILKEVQAATGLLNLDRVTVAGEGGLSKAVAAARILDDDVIRSAANA